MLTVTRGAALYIGALVGPGLLLVPALAQQAAGPAAIVAWLGVLAVSAPIAATFAALAVRHPVPGGVSAYVRESFGGAAAAVTGIWFVTAVVVGGPAVALVGGLYVAELVGWGPGGALVVAVALYVVVLAVNTAGLQVSSAVQLVVSALLVLLVGVAAGVAAPRVSAGTWTPFAPHGWWAVGTAANILMWMVFGWEAMAQLAGEFRRPRRDVPRAIWTAFAVIAVLYVALGVATIAVPSTVDAPVPLADLMAVGFGTAGRVVTTVLALVLTLGTMNVYTGSAATLTVDLAHQGALPAWFAGGAGPRTRRRPLAVLAATSTVMFLLLAMGAFSVDTLVRATSACFVAVYVLALAAAVRTLEAGGRGLAVVALAAVGVVAAFSSVYVLVPAVAAVLVLVMRRRDRGTVVAG